MKLFLRGLIFSSFVVLLLSQNAIALSEYKPDANVPRSSVPAVYKWDTSALFKSDGAWESAVSEAKGRINSLKAKRSGNNTPELLKKFLSDYMETRKLLDKISMYANLKVVEDEQVEKYQKMRQRSVLLVRDMRPTHLFEDFLRTDDAKARALINDPALSSYKDYLGEMRRRNAHLMGPETEGVLSLAGDNLFSEGASNDAPSDFEMAFKAAMRDIELPKIKDEDGKEIQLTLANYGKYRASKDRRVRKDTVEGFFAALKKYQNLFAAVLAGEVKRDVFLAQARKYKRAVDAYLDRDEIDPRVIDTLIEAIHQNLRPLHRYVEFRKKVLKLKDIHIYDLYTPIVPSVSRDVSYSEGVADVEAALKPLGEKYTAELKKGISPGSGWVDVYPNRGKESGAFSNSIWRIHPFVKLNFMNGIDDVSTLAHEFGHAMHSALNMEALPYATAGYPTIIAEVASTLSEMLLSKYLIDKYQGDDEMRLYLLCEQLERIRTTIYRQTLFAEFEKKLHAFAEAGVPLTAELFNKTYKDLIRLYYGPGLTIDENDDVEWAYIPHFYWKFYVYSYATGLSSGIALSEDVFKNGDKSRDKYLEMLMTSWTVPPLETLKKAGVDLAKPDAVGAAAGLMNETVDEMEKIIEKGQR